MNSFTNLFRQPFVCRSASNKHRYTILGKTVAALTTWKKDMEHLVAQLLGQGSSGLLSIFTPSLKQITAAGALLAVLSAQSAMALPVNPNVVNGQVTFNEGPTHLEVTQSTSG